jgi:hypothetical protein
MAISIVLSWPSFQVDLSQVQVFFKANLSSNYDGLLATATSVTVIFKSDYSDSDSDAVNNYWSSISASTFAPSTADLIQNKIFANQQFGQKLVLQIETDNVMAGLTVAQISGQLQDYALLLSMLNSGSIPTALAQTQTLQPVDGMTQDRINGYIQQIKTYLGVS